jgi:hypothetical protein
MLEFAERAETAGRPAMDAALTALMGASSLEPSIIQSWLPDWRLAFQAATQNNRADARLHPARLNYYEKAILALLASEKPHAALWSLLQTWTLAVDAVPEAESPWRAACGQLGLVAGLSERVEALDHFLDEVELLLDELATQYGLETYTTL